VDVMTLNQLRGLLHRAEVLTGDVQAVRRGRYAQRASNRILGRAVSRLMRGIWR
jgi:hypothetical protein